MSGLLMDYEEFIKNIKRKTGIDLSLYKEAQMKRRLTSLYEKRGFSDFGEFFTGIEKDSNLYNEFLDRITINVSEFFRNSSRWEVLKKKIIPALPIDKKIKCWSAACSTGEEPYTLAIILKHYFGQLNYEIEATDIDVNAIKRAQEGIYPERSMKEISQELVGKYFRQEKGLFYLADEIKKSITFKKQDLLIDSFAVNFDLIICRNVIIYFTDEAKQLLYTKFSNALKPGGILFVGSTEQIFNPSKYNLEAVDNFFYRKKNE